MSDVVANDMSHCTMQLWSPDQTSETHLYVNDAAHGYAIADLPIDKDGSALFEIVSSATDRVAEHLDGLSAVTGNFWPVVLVACRHHRLPVPPGFWIKALAGGQEAREAADDADPASSADGSDLAGV